MTTSTSQGRSGPFFLPLSCVLLPPDPPSLAKPFPLPGQRGLRSRCCLPRQRHHASLEARLVAVGLVHVAELGVRGDRAAAGADRDERAVVALLPRRERLEPRAAASRRHSFVRGRRCGRSTAWRRRRSPGRRRASRPGRWCGRAACGSRTAPCARRRRSGSRASSSPRAGTTSSRRGSGRCRRRSSTPAARPTSCTCRRAACRRADRGQRNRCPCGCGGCAGSRMIGLNATLRELVGELLLAQEVEQRRVAVDRSLVEVAADRDRGILPATCRTFSMILSKVPWPPRSGRIRLCVSRSPSSVILTPFRPQGASRSTTSGVSSSPLVMMLISIRTPRACARLPQPLGEVVQHRQVEQRLAAEERQREARRAERVEPLLGPARRPAPRSRATSSRRACCSRRDRPGCSSRRRSCTAASSAPSRAAGSRSLADVVEELLERLRGRRRGLDDEAVLGERVERVALVAVQPPVPRCRRDRAASATSRDTISCASVNVFIRNTSSPAVERDTDVEHRGLHACSLGRTGDRRSVDGDAERVWQPPPLPVEVQRDIPRSVRLSKESLSTRRDDRDARKYRSVDVTLCDRL